MQATISINLLNDDSDSDTESLDMTQIVYHRCNDEG